VTPSVAVPGNTNPSDATGQMHSEHISIATFFIVYAQKYLRHRFFLRTEIFFFLKYYCRNNSAVLCQSTSEFNRFYRIKNISGVFTSPPGTYSIAGVAGSPSPDNWSVQWAECITWACSGSSRDAVGGIQWVPCNDGSDSHQ